MAENTEPATDADSKSPDGTAASQRRAYGVKRHATSPSTDEQPQTGLEEKLADLVDSVKGLQSHLAGSRPIGETVTQPPEVRTRGPKRFQRRGGDELPEPETRVESPVLDHEVRGNEATLNKNIAWPRISRSEPTATSLGERATAYFQRHPFIIWLLVQATGLGLILLGYWAGSSLGGDEEEHTAKSDDHPVATSPTRPPAGDLLARVGINDRAMNAINAALHAEKDGNFDAARQTYEEAASGRVRLPGAEYRLAMLEIERQNFEAADIHLNNSLAAGEMMASCYFVNAFFAAKKSDFNDAAKQLAHAVRLEPFSSKYLFCYGETLRRAGKTQAAIDALGQALDRPGAPSDLELIEFKQRLAKVEFGQDEAFNKELADHLAKAPVNGDWLLLAAAQDLTHASYPAAASHLGSAAKVLPPHAFSVLVQDYLYQGYAARPELGSVLKVPAPAPSDKPFDPGAWPFSEADPATWPPFSPAL